MCRRILNDALRSMVNAEKRGMATANLHPNSTASFNFSIRSSVDRGLYRESLSLYLQMARANLRPDHLTFPFLLKASSKLADPRLSHTLHTHVLRSPFSSDPFVGTAMVNMYTKCEELGNAEKVFEEMPERDVTAWNSIILGFSQMGFLDKVLVLFCHMRLASICPDSATVICLTQASERGKELAFVRAFHCLGICIGVGEDVFVANTWISVYSKCGDLCSAKSVFGEIPAGLRSVVSWNAMISGCTCLGRSDEIGVFVRGMSRDGFRPDLSTILSLLSMLGQLEALLEGCQQEHVFLGLP